VVATASPPECDPAEVTIPVNGSLIVFDAVRLGPGDAFAGKYQFGFAGAALGTFSCFTPRITVSMPVSLYLASDCNVIATAPTWTALDHRAGSAPVSCTVFTGTVSWDLSGP
jgi:hypothetical protein